jgi:hypothetical protein
VNGEGMEGGDGFPKGASSDEAGARTGNT